MIQHMTPWTHAELRAIVPVMEAQLEASVSVLDYEVRPLPVMSHAEVRDTLLNMMNVAATRALTPQECFIHGQLLAQLETAVRAQMLGFNGRFLVMTEAQILEQIEAAKKGR